MPESFDPYHKWLGIPPAEQPPNHYRLIGVSLFESDPDVIDAVCDQRMAFVQQCATGPHSGLSQQLLNELAAARVCLLVAETKRVYDAALRATLQQHAGSAAPTQERDRARPAGKGVPEASTDGIVPVLDTAGSAPLRRLVGRRLRRSWLFWLAVHCLVLYLGWTYLLSPRLRSNRRAAPVAQATPSARRATQPPTVTETTQIDPVRRPSDATDFRAPDGSPEDSARAGGSSATNAETKKPKEPAQDPPGRPAIQPPSVQLPGAVELPPLDDSTPVTLGTTALVGEPNVELGLHSDAAAVGPTASFHVERGPGASRWTACLVSGTDEPQHTPVADFMIHRDALRFQWRDSVDETAEQLRNCRLRLSLGQQRWLSTLRKPKTQPGMTIDLSSKTDRHELDIPAAPSGQILFLEVLRLENFPAQAKFEDARRVAQLGKEDLVISLDERYGAQIEIGFDRYRRTGLALSVSPVFRLEGRRTELTMDRLERLRKQVEMLPSSQQRLNTLQNRASALDNDLRRLGSQRTNDAFQRAALLSEIARVRGNLDRTNREIRSLERRIVELKQFRQGLPGLEELAADLHKTAKLRYRVFATTESGEFDLLRGE